nr:MAG TPA: hypothetical protein [Bacteriophage sp.]DAY34995.1 MAG TPA: hypothetical protein [Bacteriophage sp.]
MPAFILRRQESDTFTGAGRHPKSGIAFQLLAFVTKSSAPFNI